MVETGGLAEASMELQLLTVSDPVARSHMIRHVVALRKLLTGAVSDEEVPGLMIATTFGVTETAEAHHRVAAPNPKQFKPGYRRASDRMASLAESASIRAVAQKVIVYAGFDDLPR